MPHEDPVRAGDDELGATAPAGGAVATIWSVIPVDWFGLCFCIMLGTAGLPHILVALPAYAAFAKWTVLTDVIGKKGYGAAAVDLPLG